MSGDVTPSGHRLEHLPDGTARIHFAAPILEHADQPRRHVDFRPYTIMERLEIGDPLQWVYASQSTVPFVDKDILKAWFRKLMIGHDPDILGRVSDPALAEMIEAALLGFFQTARIRSRPESAPSSATESPSPTSPA